MTLAERIEEARQALTENQALLSATERELAALLAEQAEAAKTPGQRVAEKFVELGGANSHSPGQHYVRLLRDGALFTAVAPVSNSGSDTVSRIRNEVARLVDEALASRPAAPAGRDEGEGK